MKKDNINRIFREYVKNNLSPTKTERDLVSNIYEAIKITLNNKCLLVGSYARFTAITPLHDIDIIYIDGLFKPDYLNPQQILDNLQNIIRKYFVNPTRYPIKISLQTHSITISFTEKQEELFAVDIVPAYISGLKNEYGDDIYYVPQILNTNRRYRQQRYEELNKNIKNEIDWWLKSDPHGYIKSARDLNSQNNDFRKTVKFVKRWKHNCKEKQADFKLKSFHIEQVIYEIYTHNPNVEIIDAIFIFFCNIPIIIKNAQIKDRADNNKYIDEYVEGLTDLQKRKIIEARDKFLIELENIIPSKSISSLLDAEFYVRACPEEQYLFDDSIPVYLEDLTRFKIDGKVLPKDGFRGNWWLSTRAGRIEKNRKIEFQITENSTNASLYKWKVKNDNSSQHPRGEITDNHTRNNPESTEYTGSHYVECYAIKNGVCIAKSRSNVIIH